MNRRFRILARIPKGQGEPVEVVRGKIATKFIFDSHDPDDAWYRDNVPCRRACPADTRIPEYLGAAFRGEYDKVLEINLRDNVLPGVLGRVCAHPCEDACRHGNEGMGSPVSICWLKRSGADHKSVEPVIKKAPSTGKRIAVIGAGPAGLALAFDFSLWGHDVTVYDEREQPGGMLRYGIPRFRLPEKVLDEDIKRVSSLGVTFKQGVKLGSGVHLDELAKQFDAVIVAAGCQLSQDLDIPGANATGVVSGLEFMDKINTHAIKQVDGDVLVLGGGFTAMDCSRSSWRLGAKSVTVVYRRSRNELKVDDRELAETSGEGIGFEYLLSPVAVITGSDGRVTGLKLQRNTLGEPGPDGRRSITPVTGSHGQIEMKADMIIAATGQSADRSLTGGTRPDPLKPVGKDNVFATGDYVTGASSIIGSIGTAHKTARVVDQFLMGRNRFEERTMGREEWPRLNFAGGSYQGWKAGCGNGFDLIPRLDNPSVPLEKRRAQDIEADFGYSKPQTFQQGQRCYLCDHNIQIDGSACILCYNCVDVCPYNCIHMRAEENVRVAQNGKFLGEGKGHTYMIIDETNCVRCGLCLDVCPDDCITMERREIASVFTP